MKKIILSIAATMLSCTLFAQADTLRAIVNVHNEYNPVHIKVNKKSFVPTTDNNSHKNSPRYQFTSEAKPYGGFMSERDTKGLIKEPAKPYSGYARAGYGIGNELDIKAAYNRDLTKRDNIRFFAAVDGYKRDINRYQSNSKWHSRMYNSSVDLSYTHKFNGLKIDIAGDFNNRIFNYQDTEAATEANGSQNSMNYRVHLNGTSTHKGALRYRFNASYTHNERKYTATGNNSLHENRASAGANIWYTAHNSLLRKAGLALAFDAFIYNKTLLNANNPYNNYYSADIAPYFDLSTKGWDIHLGVKMNILTDNGPLLAVAPNVKIKRDLDSGISFYATATGGRTNNNFSKLESITPYWNFDAYNSPRLKPTYKLIDAGIGTTMSFGAFALNIAGGYAFTKDDLLQYKQEDTFMLNDFIYSNFSQADTHNAHALLSMSYDLGGWLKIAGDARYDYWNCSNRALLLMKPEATCNISTEIKPFRGMTLSVNYNFTYFTKSINGTRADSKSDLSARASYKILSWLGIYAQGSNLLGDRYLEYAGYEARGARALLGLSANF